jgi:hypothetical protein
MKNHHTLQYDIGGFGIGYHMMVDVLDGGTLPDIYDGWMVSELVISKSMIENTCRYMGQRFMIDDFFFGSVVQLFP